jgi:hypothetical protein
MEEGETNQDSSDAEDAIVTIWGQRPASGPARAGDAAAVDIWGSAPVEAAATDEPDPIDPPPDLWGDGEKRRAGREPNQGDPGPIQFLLPSTWAATPKRRRGWVSRLRRT